MRYTVDFDDGDDDRWPTWVVLEWVADGVANVIEHCYTEAEAESFARAYTAIERKCGEVGCSFCDPY